MEEFEEKVCNRCNNKLDITLFRKKPNSEERKNICKFCERKLKKEGFRYCRECEKIYLATSENFSERNIKGRKTLDTLCVNCNRERVSRWQKENKEKTNEKIIRYQRTEKGKKATYKKRSKYINKIDSLPNTLTSEQWNLIKEHFKNSCAYCGQVKRLEHDHVVPVSKNGELTHNNIVPSCRNCNASKGNKDFKEWYKQQPFYSPEREKAILDFLGYKEDKQQLKLI